MGSSFMLPMVVGNLEQFEIPDQRKGTVREGMR